MSRWKYIALTLGLTLVVGCSDDTTQSDAAADGAPRDGAPDAGLSDGAGDAGAPVWDPAPTVTKCSNPALTPPASGTCAVTKGTGTAVLYRGTLLAPDAVYQNGHLLVDSGKITCVGCDCSKSTGYSTATRVECARGVISPGLINPHDHIAWNRYYPVSTSVRYDHRNEWRTGENGKPEIKYKSGSYSSVSLAWAELRMIIGGATSVMGATSGADKLLRNLDGKNEGLSAGKALDKTFPLGDIDGKLLTDSCSYKSKPSVTTCRAASAYVPHVSEGGSAAAHNEFLCLSSSTNGGVDVTIGNAAFIHSVGLTAADILDMAKGGTMAIWSPRTNIGLYGYTADVMTMHKLGVGIALGTDWTISGSMNMLRELNCASSYNSKYLGGYFADWQLWRMVTGAAADSCGAGKEIGKLKQGYWADLAIFDGSTLASGDWAHKAVLSASVQQVVLVTRAGLPLSGDTALVTALDSQGGSGCEALSDCLKDKSACVKRETGKTLSELKTAVLAASPTLQASELFPLYYCGAPTKETTCTPSRPNEYPRTGITDSDGDGIEDSKDNCPKIFNPVLKLHSTGKQGDGDSDSIGDPCDPCPMDANTTICKTRADPNDSDGDGVPNEKDNCPDVANKDQKDSDGDLKGDACDDCPNYKNPGNAPCLVTVKQLRDASATGHPTKGAKVSLSKVLVTSVPPSGSGAKGFYVREGTGAYEAIFIYTASTSQKATDGTPLKPGHELDISGSYTIYYNMDEIISPTSIKITNASSTITAPAPVDIKTADLQPKSTTGEKLESHLVRVKKVTVAVGPSTYDSFWVTDSASACSGSAPACTQVGDFYYDARTKNGKPAGKKDQTFSSITGVVNGYADSYSLDPATDSDLVTP